MISSDSATPRAARALAKAADEARLPSPLPPLPSCVPLSDPPLSRASQLLSARRAGSSALGANESEYVPAVRRLGFRFVSEVDAEVVAGKLAALVVFCPGDGRDWLRTRERPAVVAGSVSSTRSVTKRTDLGVRTPDDFLESSASAVFPALSVHPAAPLLRADCFESAGATESVTPTLRVSASSVWRIFAISESSVSFCFLMASTPSSCAFSSRAASELVLASVLAARSERLRRRALRRLLPPPLERVSSVE
mmetsp:Transcript_38823/g.85315  ORF Transcript_38823/g.85315 Transcript_38823/m.85315 type:complete len:252 (+) Transcript_38823:521-1276(+)